MIDQTPAVAFVPDILDATDGVETPFGKRWGGDVVKLSAEHIAALQAGQTIALDVQNEYVVFLQVAGSENKRTSKEIPAG